MSAAFVEKMDMILRLFDGDISLSELISLDMPSQRALVQARINNLRKSQEAFDNGRIDAYSRRYASTMGGGLGLGNSGSTSIQYKPSSPSQNESSGSGQEFDRSRSRNARDYLNG